MGPWRYARVRAGIRARRRVDAFVAAALEEVRTRRSASGKAEDAA